MEESKELQKLYGFMQAFIYITVCIEIRKHSKKCTFYTLRFDCSFAAVNTIKPQLL